MEKILLVATEYASGMVPFASSIINTLSRSKKLDVYAIVVENEQLQYCKAIESHRKVWFVKYPYNKWYRLQYKIYPREIIKAIQEINSMNKFHAVHFLTGDFSLAIWLKYMQRENRNKLYYTVHDLVFHETQELSILDTMLKKYISWGCKLMREIIPNLTTSSKEQFKMLNQYYPQKNIHFTHFPSLITKSIVSGKTQVLELNKIDNYVLFFGNVDIYKGVDILIEAFRKSKISATNKLVIAGKGLQLVQNDKQIIRINRYIQDSELRDLFSKARIVVYPYISATMSGVLSLAYYFEKKVILSDIPFFIENKTCGAIYFEKNNVESLKEKLEMTIQKDCPLKDNYELLYSKSLLVSEYCKLYGI